MSGAVGVPQRENGICGKVVARVNLQVGTAIATVNILSQSRLYERMIHCGVENLALFLASALNDNLVEFAVPSVGSILAQSIEIPVWNFLLHILQRTFLVNLRNGNLYKHLIYSTVGNFKNIHGLVGTAQRIAFPIEIGRFHNRNIS